MSDWIQAWFPETAPATWGARAIFTDGFVDVLHDRQNAVGEKPAIDRLLSVLNGGLLADFKRHAERLRHWGELESSSREVYVMHEGDVILTASTNASYGYLYIVAFLSPKEEN